MKTNSGKPGALRVSRPIVFIDLETTGTAVGLDRIVEIGAVKVAPNGKESEFEARVNPEIRIPIEATKVHGITDEDVRDEPTFAEIAPRLSKFLAGADVAGYNLVSFDLPILESEYRRARMPLALKNRAVVDVKTIFFSRSRATSGPPTASTAAKRIIGSTPPPGMHVFAGRCFGDNWKSIQICQTPQKISALSSRS